MQSQASVEVQVQALTHPQRVFVSYVRENSLEVQRLAADLARAGVEVWLDRDSLTAGERWADAIVAAIQAGSFFLPCFSREFVLRERSYMEEELHVARAVLASRRLDRPWCIPLLLDRSSPSDVGLNDDPVLGALHCVSMWPDWADGLRRILQTVSPERSFGRCLNSLPTPTADPLATAPLLCLDFGTSKSLLAYRDRDSKWVPVRAIDGRSLFDSVVTFSENWDWWAGAEAVEAARIRPERCVQNVKRILARAGDVVLGHKRFDAVTVASLLIRHMKDCAERQLGQPIREVLIAAPIRYSRGQRAALRAACQLAGLEVMRIIGESTSGGILAAEWASKAGVVLNADAQVLVLVVDIGGGTTDLTLLELASGDGDWQFEVLDTSGDLELGGMDYDIAFQTLLFDRQLRPLVDRGLPWSERDERRLRLLTIQLKHALAENASCAASLSDLELQPGESASLSIVATRGDLEASGARLNARVMSLLDPLDKLAKSEAERWATYKHVSFDDLERPDFVRPPLQTVAQPLAAVILAGQGARYWSLATQLRKRYPQTPIVSTYQDSAVAQGLALQGEVLDGRRKDYLLLDATTLNLGLRCRSVERTNEKGTEKEKTTPVLRLSLKKEDPFEWFVLIERGRTIPTLSSVEAVVDGPGTLQVIFGEWVHSPTTAETVSALNCEIPVGPQQLTLKADIDANGTTHLSVSRRSGNDAEVLVRSAKLL